MDGQVHPGLRGQKGRLLQDDLLAGLDGQGQDAPGEAGAKGDHTSAAGGVDILEHTLAGEDFGEHLAQAAAGGAHLHVGGHPHHRALFRHHLFSIGQLADHHGEGPAFQFVCHNIASLLYHLL